ncbi:MAG TPA: response regulator transcription factor [Candidatus Angelobacter sp.]|nr:response regulator transcription factor [Candidatus Angelobacter sp.]
MAELNCSGSGKKHRIFLVDDHPLIRQGLRLLINGEDDLSICGEADESCPALQSILITRPDGLIVDISLNGPDGLELVKDVRGRFSALPILVLSMYDELIYAERALRAGANGYIMKQEASQKVLLAIRRILGREIYVSDSVAAKMLHQYVNGATSCAHSLIGDLTDRELEVFRLIGHGHSTRQIAEDLHLSIKTVETYQAHIKEKLSLRSARELIQHAVRWTMGDRAA